MMFYEYDEMIMTYEFEKHIIYSIQKIGFLGMTYRYMNGIRRITK